MIKEIGKIEYTNPVVRNYYGIKERFVSFLDKNRLSLFVDNNRVIVYDKDGNDLEHMSLKQLTRRVTLS